MAADSACCIRVACRIRPLNSKEKSSGSQFVVKFPRETSVALGVSDSARIWPPLFTSFLINYSRLQNKVFNFDSVFKPDTTQVKVYESTALPLVKGIGDS